MDWWSLTFFLALLWRCGNPMVGLYLLTLGCGGSVPWSSDSTPLIPCTSLRTPNLKVMSERQMEFKFVFTHGNPKGDFCNLVYFATFCHGLLLFCGSTVAIVLFCYLQCFSCFEHSCIQVFFIFLFTCFSHLFLLLCFSLYMFWFLSSRHGRKQGAGRCGWAPVESHHGNRTSKVTYIWSNRTPSCNILTCVIPCNTHGFRYLLIVYCLDLFSIFYMQQIAWNGRTIGAKEMTPIRQVFSHPLPKTQQLLQEEMTGGAPRCAQMRPVLKDVERGCCTMLHIQIASEFICFWSCQRFHCTAKSFVAHRINGYWRYHCEYLWILLKRPSSIFECILMPAEIYIYIYKRAPAPVLISYCCAIKLKHPSWRPQGVQKALHQICPKSCPRANVKMVDATGCWSLCIPQLFTEYIGSLSLPMIF